MASRERKIVLEGKRTGFWQKTCRRTIQLLSSSLVNAEISHCGILQWLRDMNAFREGEKKGVRIRKRALALRALSKLWRIEGRRLKEFK
jgi:hypothetical protein